MSKQDWLLTANKALYKQIIAQWGNGWKLLGDDLKRAVICERVLQVFAQSDESVTITPAKISERLRSMLDFCGLTNE